LEHLKSIGLESGAILCHINSCEQITTGMFKDLWNTENLNKNYEKQSHIIKHSISRVAALGLEDAARESLLLGRQTISLLMNDPLLPEPFVNVEVREQFTADVKKLYEVGQRLLKQLHELTFGTAETSLLNLELPAVADVTPKILN
ncbi:PaaX family transcriptional regulator, partial [Acinetobacter baumannii]|nr:PaaX family transcriptional regulator [Acinetobacter baumannii]